MLSKSRKWTVFDMEILELLGNKWLNTALQMCKLGAKVQSVPLDICIGTNVHTFAHDCH